MKKIAIYVDKDDPSEKFEIQKEQMWIDEKIKSEEFIEEKKHMK